MRKLLWILTWWFVAKTLPNKSLSNIITYSKYTYYEQICELCKSMILYILECTYNHLFNNDTELTLTLFVMLRLPPPFSNV